MRLSRIVGPVALTRWKNSRIFCPEEDGCPEIPGRNFLCLFLRLCFLSVAPHVFLRVRNGDDRPDTLRHCGGAPACGRSLAEHSCALLLRPESPAPVRTLRVRSACTRPGVFQQSCEGGMLPAGKRTARTISFPERVRAAGCLTECACICVSGSKCSTSDAP